MLLIGYGAFVVRGNLVTLAIAVALTLAGPLEDMLMKRYVKNKAPKSHTERLIDQSTSVGFLIFLLIAQLLVI